MPLPPVTRTATPLTVRWLLNNRILNLLVNPAGTFPSEFLQLLQQRMDVSLVANVIRAASRKSGLEIWIARRITASEQLVRARILSRPIEVALTDSSLVSGAWEATDCFSLSAVLFETAKLAAMVAGTTGALDVPSSPSLRAEAVLTESTCFGATSTPVVVLRVEF